MAVSIRDCLNPLDISVEALVRPEFMAQSERGFHKRAVMGRGG
jgi:hypothetical protein